MISASTMINEYFKFLDPDHVFMNREMALKDQWQTIPLHHFNVVNVPGFDLSEVQVFVPSGEIPASNAYEFRILSQPRGTVLALSSFKGGKISLVLRGTDQRVAIFSELSMSFNARLVGESRLVVGEETAIMGARLLLNNSSLLVGCSGLWSDEVIVQTSDQHGIVDLKTKSLINLGKSETHIGRHVWLGRRCMVLKGLTIGKGSIVGAGAIVSKTLPSMCVAVGNPARPVRQGVSWCENFAHIRGSDVEEIDTLASCLSDEC